MGQSHLEASRYDTAFRMRVERNRHIREFVAYEEKYYKKTIITMDTLH